MAEDLVRVGRAQLELAALNDPEGFAEMMFKRVQDLEFQLRDAEQALDFIAGDYGCETAAQLIASFRADHGYNYAPEDVNASSRDEANSDV